MHCMHNLCEVIIMLKGLQAKKLYLLMLFISQVATRTPARSHLKHILYNYDTNFAHLTIEPAQPTLHAFVT